MILHYAVYIISALLAKLVEKTGKKVESRGQTKYENRAQYIAAFFACLPMIIIYGFRSSIGDTTSYLYSFRDTTLTGGLFDDLSDRSPGFDILLRIFKFMLVDNEYYWVFFMTLISMLFLLASFSKYSPMFGLSIFLFFGSTEISYLLNGARQFFAIAIMVYALKYLEKGKLIPYIVTLLVAASIHLTALIFVPVYFVVRGKFLNIKMIFLSLGVIAATAFSSLFINYLNDLFLEDSVYSGYYDFIVADTGVNIFRFFVALVPFLLCFIYRKRIADLNDDSLNILANLSMLAVAVMLFSLTAGGDYLGRLAEYFLIFNCILYPVLLKRVISKNVYPIFMVGIIVGYFIFYTYQFYIKWDLGYSSDYLGIYIGESEDV